MLVTSIRAAVPPAGSADRSWYRETGWLRIFALVLGMGLALPLPLPAQSNRTLFMDEAHRLRPGDWSFAEIPVGRPDTLIRAEYRVLTAGLRVRLSLIRPPELERFRRDRRARFLVSTPLDRAGKVVHLARQPGSYLLLVESADSDHHDAADVHLRIEIEPNRTARELPPARKAAVIAFSLILFFVLVAAIYRKLRPHLRQA